LLSANAKVKSFSNPKLSIGIPPVAASRKMSKSDINHPAHGHRLRAKRQEILLAHQTYSDHWGASCCCPCAILAVRNFTQEFGVNVAQQA
jgi:hypothetical protein